MILDTIENADRYLQVHKLFEIGFRFLRETDLAKLPAGRIDLAPEGMYANVDDAVGKGRMNAVLEAHQKYIDIQFIVRGRDEIGHSPLADCRRITDPYNEARDISFFGDSPRSWFILDANSFAIFHPTDAHAPLAGNGPLRKIVVKVPVDG